MTYDQAVRIRARQLQGGEVNAQQLEEAIAVIQNTRTPTKWPDQSTKQAKKAKKPKVPKPKKEPALGAAAPAPAPADPWPLLTPETEAQVLSASRNAWAVIGRQE